MAYARRAQLIALALILAALCITLIRPATVDGKIFGQTALPDLVVRWMSIGMDGPGCMSKITRMGTRATIANNGTAAAGAFVLEVNGVRQNVAGLAAGQSMTVFFSGYRYGQQSVATVDVTNVVVESNEGNNTLAQMLAIPTPPPPCPTLLPAADSFVRDGSFANTNYGTGTLLQAKTAACCGYTRHIYLRFDLSSVSTISSARLQMYGKIGGADNPSITVEAFGAGSSWTETGITWNNRTALTSGVLARATIKGTTASWYEWDLTAYAKAEKSAGRNQITVVLKVPTSVTNTVDLNSREAGSTGPLIAYTR